MIDRNAISDFDKYLKDIYSTNNPYGTEQRGYLINLKDYERIKKIIYSNKININNLEKNFKINQIEFKTSQYLINMILNGNKYIFINTDLWKLLYDKDKRNEIPIKYKVNINDITFSLDNKELSFKHNKNIIDKNSLNYSDSYKSNYEKITKIVDSIIKYYNFENKILNDLKNKQDSKATTTYGYLISKIWIDKWKKISNYENIKTNYLQNNKNNKEDIMNDLIYYLEKNKINYNELPNSINIIKLNKKEEIESDLKNESLVLIDSGFLFYFNHGNSGNLIKYNVFNNKINIYLDNDEILSFKSNNNILSLNEIINYSHLKQLIKIFYFQKAIKSSIEDRSNNKQINLINNKVINIYKNIFNYKKLYDSLKNNLNTKNINYDDLRNYYYKIINELNDDYITQCSQIKENEILKEFRNINENFIELEYKINSPSEKNLKYITNFEIVDKDIKDFFIKNNIAKEKHFIPLKSYKCDKGKILIIFERNNNIFYEIGHFKDNEDFIIEYLIDYLENINKYSIIDYFFKYGINSFMNKSKNIINLEYQRKCYYYKIEGINTPKENKRLQTFKTDAIIKNNNIFDFRDNFKSENNLNNDNNIKEQNNNFYDYNNPYLLKAIKLYFYYHEFSKKIKETNNDEKEYYLINNNLLYQIKNNYKYNQIKVALDKINFMGNYYSNKKLAIQSLSKDIIKYFTDNKEIKDKFEKDNMEPDIVPINDHKEKKSFMIYDKFEILEREMAQDLINIYSTKNNYLKCGINEGKIIIHYPQNFNGNDKYISVIGHLNNENRFLNEYILIYNDFSPKFGHMQSIKRNLNNYLTSLQLYENSAPIVDNNYKEIGIIIKYSNETFNYNLNNLEINRKEIKNDINNNSSKEIINNRRQMSMDIPKNDFFNKLNNNEDEYNLDYQTNSHKIRDNFVFPPKIGLQNIGATCYMNATLQCFCHIEKFVNYFKYSKHVISMVRSNKNNLTSSFKLLIEKLWPNNYNESYSQKDYAPEEFKNKISKMNPLFEGVSANDAKDLVNFIIMTLHQELNKAKKSNNNNNIILDQRNQQTMFNYFIHNFKLENQSIISDLFYGVNCNITQCCNCNANIYNYQIYFFLVFPLEEVRKFRNNNFINNAVNIYDCFDYDRKVNLMYGDNSMYCNYCKQNTNCNMYTCLTTGPEILILLLNRGQGIEFNVKIYFMEDLDLSNYIQLNNTGAKYKLIGVITHIGESGMSGHFIAYCKDPISQSWNKYNDAIVSEVQDQDFQKEVINFAMPYLLFYQKSS